MALFNYASKEITLKVVYYGPGLCGKTTNLQKLHETMTPDKKSKLLSLSTESDRTLFFDFMPVSLGKIRDFNIKFQLYTVPGQVRYNATRKLVLKGADAIVFVADSQTAMKDQNIESLVNMKENLVANNIKPDEIPVVLQYNKRDLANILSVEELDQDLNPNNDQTTEAAAIDGTGVEDTFKLVTTRLLRYISKKHNVQIENVEEPPAPKPAKAPVQAKKPVAAKPAQKTPGRVSEAEIEESILKTSMPEQPAKKDAAMDWSDLIERPEEAPAPPEGKPKEEGIDWGALAEESVEAVSSKPTEEATDWGDLLERPEETVTAEKAPLSESAAPDLDPSSLEILDTLTAEKPSAAKAKKELPGSQDIQSQLLNELKEIKRLQKEILNKLNSLA
jgi:small GTP-binding protein